jgi:hypothetical protein
VPVAHALRDAMPGDLVEFGRYPEQADGADRTTVPWLVWSAGATRVDRSRIGVRPAVALDATRTVGPP